MENEKRFLKYVDRILKLVKITFALAASLFFVLMLWVVGPIKPTITSPSSGKAREKSLYWQAPDISLSRNERNHQAIAYGRELIAHTSKYLGPEGSVKHISNGLNCQSCHLDAGTKVFGNNYGAVAATYPKYRARSGQIESIEKRVNDCFERSMNGEPLDTASAEMDAIVSYIKFIGKGVNTERLPEGVGLKKIRMLDRAADPIKGKEAYTTHCVACHGKSGQGIKQPGASEYQFPPLWGDNSYNHGAGMYRLSNFAQFIHANMPLGATFENPVLSEQEAWDIAAYVNSLPRPEKDLSADWPKIETKPFDHPFGPFADPYSASQHKFGPYKEIQAFYSSKN